MPNLKKTVVILVGRQGSGKTTLSQYLAKYLKTTHIETSDVVKKLYDLPREQLAKTGERTTEDPEWLGREVSKVIEAKTKQKSVIVISGPREIELVKYLEEKYDLYSFQVVAPVPIRYKRLKELGKVKDAHDFICGEIREIDLGVKEVEDDAPFAIPTSDETEPDKIVIAAVKFLRSKGARLR